MGNNYDGHVNCPHCGERHEGPNPASKTKQYLRVCYKCKCAYVIQDLVTHHYQTAIPAPMKVGDKFRIIRRRTPQEEDPVYNVVDVYLTDTQGWWVTGEGDGMNACNVPCEKTVMEGVIQ